MAEFEIAGPARRDLREIYDWIAQDDPAAADQVLSDLRDAIVRLAEMPGLGHVREDLADQSLRAWTVHRYVVIDQPERTPRLVVRALSGYRDIGSMLLGRRRRHPWGTLVGEALVAGVLGSIPAVAWIVWFGIHPWTRLQGATPVPSDRHRRGVCRSGALPVARDRDAGCGLGPDGDRAAARSRVGLYVYEPSRIGLDGEPLTTTFAADVQVPTGAVDTGYRTDDVALWVFSGDEPPEGEAVYLVGSDGEAQRWPALLGACV